MTLTVSAGTADETKDFAPIAPLTIEIDAGRTKGTTTFVLTPVDDAIDEDDETVVIQGTAANRGVTIWPEADLTLTIIDDDIRRVLVAPTQLKLQQYDLAKYTVVLDSEPTDMVMITMSVDSDTSISREPDTLMFSTQNWMDPQEVTVRSNSKLDYRHDQERCPRRRLPASIPADDVVVVVTETQAESVAERNL